MAKINVVIAGDYEGKQIQKIGNSISIQTGGIFSSSPPVPIDKSTVESYEKVEENYRKSSASAVGRGLVGGFLLGGVGLLAGLGAKNKGAHTFQLNFINGKRSLIVVDDKIKSILVKALF